VKHSPSNSGSASRQGQTLHAASSQRVAELAAEFPIAIVQKIAALVQVPVPSIVAFRATCSIQHESGCRVIPPSDTRRLPISMKKRT
jgi:hypothetical protein